MFLEDNLEVMVEKVGSEIVTLLEDKSQDIKKTLSKVKTRLAPYHQSKKPNSSKASKKKIVNAAEHSLGSPCERPQVSDESTTISRPKMSEMNLLDLSPLKSLAYSLFDHATSYDKKHSNFVDKAHKDKKMELLSNAKERLELFRIEEGEKGKHVSSNKKSLRKVKRKLETLQGE
uniref:Uncharacterized protein n=1 Tax=Solanum tuberosum TaxID=4113 RepID=M1DTL8_SOLTU